MAQAQPPGSDTAALLRPGSLGELIDGQAISPFQYRVIVLCTLIAFIEGFDTQSVGFVAPDLARAFSLAPDVLGMFFSTGLFGLMIGAVLIAPLADRFGRRPLILLGTLTFGAASLVIAFVTTTELLFAVRFLMGAGIGAVMPNLIALTSEYSPRRKRPMIIMLMFSGFTLGSLTAGIVTARLIGSFGWTIVFVVGGVMPLILLPVLLRYLPESVGWLATKTSARDKLRSLVARINPTIDPYALGQENLAEQAAPRSSVLELLRGGRAAGTILLWLIFFCSLINIYLLVSWLPTLMSEQGFTPQQSAWAGSVFQLGGLVGVLPVAWLSTRWPTHVVLALSYVVAAISIPAIGSTSESLPVILAFTFLAGAGILSGQCAANALAADLFGTELRATAVGAALGIGRIGSIIGPALAGFLLAAGYHSAEILMLSAIPGVIAAGAAVLIGGRLIARPQR